jgi:hypothetical protein
MGFNWRKQLTAARAVVRIPLGPVDETPLREPEQLARKLRLRDPSIDASEAGARAAVLRWIVWRAKALRLACALALVSSIVTIADLSTTMADYGAAKRHCDWAEEQHATRASGEHAERRRLAGGAPPHARTGRNFPADANYSSATASTCDRLLAGGGSRSALMEAEAVSHTMLLGPRRRARNAVCGTFTLPVCVPSPVDLVPALLFQPADYRSQVDLSQEITAAPNGCSGATPNYCGRAYDAARGLCPSRTPFERDTLVACSRVFCRATDDVCPAGAPCADAVLCGYDDYGEVCAATKSACAGAVRWTTLSFNVAASGGTFGSTESIYATQSACELGLQQQLGGGAAAAAVPADLLLRSVSLGTADIGAPVAAGWFQATPERAALPGVGSAGFRDAAFFNSSTRISRVFDTPYRSKTSWSAKLSTCGCLPSVGGLAVGKLLNFAVMKCSGPPDDLAAVHAGPNITFGAYCQNFEGMIEKTYRGGDGPQPTVLGVAPVTQQLITYKEFDAAGNPTRALSFNRTGSCCTFPVEIARQAGETAARLNVAGTYSPTGNTLHGRPIYQARNLGPTASSVFLYFWPDFIDAASPGLTWVVGPSVPTGVSAEHSARVGATAFLTVQDVAFSADKLTTGATWAVRDSALRATGALCEDNDAQFLALVAALEGFEYGMAMTSCADATWAGLCDAAADAAAAACPRSCGKCPGYPAACFDADAALAVVSDGVLTSCRAASWACHLPPGMDDKTREGMLALCPRTCGLCAGQPPGSAVCEDSADLGALFNVTTVGCQRMACAPADDFSCSSPNNASRFCPSTCGACPPVPAPTPPPDCDVCSRVPGAVGPLVPNRAFNSNITCALAQAILAPKRACSCGGVAASPMMFAASKCCTSFTDVCNLTAGFAPLSLNSSIPLSLNSVPTLKEALPSGALDGSCGTAANAISRLRGFAGADALQSDMATVAARCCCRVMPQGTELPSAGMLYTYNSQSTAADFPVTRFPVLAGQQQRFPAHPMTLIFCPTVPASRRLQRAGAAPSWVRGASMPLTHTPPREVAPRGLLRDNPVLRAQGRRRLAEAPAMQSAAAEQEQLLQLTSATLDITRGNGTVFCTNGNEQEDAGTLSMDNVDATASVTVRVAVWHRAERQQQQQQQQQQRMRRRLVADFGFGPVPAGGAPKLEQFTARLCYAEDGCVETGPLSCFNDLVQLPPRASLSFPIVANATTHEPVMVLEWQAVRDESAHYRSQGVAAAASSTPAGFTDGVAAAAGAANAANSAASDGGGARRRLLTEPAADGPCNSSAPAPAPTPATALQYPWTVCNANTHKQSKFEVCTARDGTLPLPSSMCEAQGLGGASQHRACCTEEEMVKAEYIRKWSSAIGTATLQVIPALPPLWWAASTARARHNWKAWRTSTRWVAIGWGLPFFVMFAQYLAPWQYMMDLDNSALVASLLSARSDNPTRSRDSHSGACGSAGVANASAINSLTGAGSPLGVLANAKSVADKASNLDAADASTATSLDGAFQKVALQQLQAQYELYAKEEEKVYVFGQRLAYSLSSTAALVPLAFSLLPGVARGAMFAKLTMPTSPIPGWVFVACPLIFTPLLAVAILSVVQLLSHPLVSVAALLFSAAPLVPLWHSRSFLAAHNSPPAVRDARIFALTCTCNTIKLALMLASAVCLVAYVFSVKLVQQLNVRVADLFTSRALLVLLFKSATNYFITTVLACDVICLAIVEIRKAERKTPELSSSDAECMAAAVEVSEKHKHKGAVEEHGFAILSENHEGGVEMTVRTGEKDDKSVPNPVAATGEGGNFTHTNNSGRDIEGGSDDGDGAEEGANAKRLSHDDGNM